MASETGPAADPLKQLAALLEQPHRFDFFEAMRRVECAWNELPRLGTAARTRYAAQFDPRAAGRRILEIYWELVGSARLPGAPSPAA